MFLQNRRLQVGIELFAKNGFFFNGGVVDSTATLRTYVDNFVNYQKDRLLQIFHNQIVSPQFGMRSEKIPTGKGDTVQWDLAIKQTRPAAAIAENTDIAPQLMYESKKTQQAEEWGDAVETTRRLQLIHKHLAGSWGWNYMTDKVAESMAEALDYRCLGVLATNGYRMRVDRNTDYEKNVSTTSDGNAGGTTLLSTTLTQAESFWVGAYVTIMGLDTAKLSRASYQETRPVSAFANATGTVTVSTAFPSIIKSGCAIHICVGTGITEGDIITTNVISVMGRQLKRNKGIRFNDTLVTKGMIKQTQNLPPGGAEGVYWTFILDQDHEYDFMKDTDWKATGVEQDIKALQNGVIKKWMGCQFYGTTQAWREDVDGTENEASGVVHPVIALAQEAYGITPVEEPGSKDLGIGGNFAVTINLKRPEDFGDFGKIRSSVAAQAYFAIRSLMSGCNIVMLGGCSA